MGGPVISGANVSGVVVKDSVVREEPGEVLSEHFGPFRQNPESGEEACHTEESHIMGVARLREC